MIPRQAVKSYPMHLIPLLPPLVRALTTAAIVVGASAAAEALGPFWGAVIASLPVSAGPAYVFLAMQHGEAFLAASALGSLVANASTGLFLTVYGVLAARGAGWRALGAAVIAWLGASVLGTRVAWTPAAAMLLNLAVYGGGFVVLRAGAPAAGAGGGLPAARRGRFDLAARALAVAALVTVVTAASSALGPGVTGIAAVFPISLLSLIVILLRRLGVPATEALAAGALRAMLGFGVMLLILHLTVEALGAAAALGLALAVSAAWSAGLLALRARAQAPGGNNC